MYQIIHHKWASCDKQLQQAKQIKYQQFSIASIKHMVLSLRGVLYSVIRPNGSRTIAGENDELRSKTLLFRDNPNRRLTHSKPKDAQTSCKSFGTARHVWRWVHFMSLESKFTWCHSGVSCSNCSAPSAILRLGRLWNTANHDWRAFLCLDAQHSFWWIHVNPSIWRRKDSRIDTVHASVASVSVTPHLGNKSGPQSRCHPPRFLLQAGSGRAVPERFSWKRLFQRLDPIAWLSLHQSLAASI